MSRRKSVGNIRDAQRHEVERLRNGDVYLPNPSAEAPVDRRRPLKRYAKAAAFGMTPSPDRLFELIAGDAGAGETIYRKIHAYYQLAEPPVALPNRLSRSPYSNALAIATVRSSTQNPKFWHVSVYGIGVRRPSIVGGPPIFPLTDSEIRDRQFIGYQVEFPPGTFVNISTEFVPRIPTAQVRVMVHDESGQRFFDADVLGNRSFNLYGFGVTVFLLVKPEGYEVDAQNPGSLTPFTGNGLGVEDDLVGARIVGLFSSRSESVQNRTLSITVDPSDFAGVAPRIVPIPPGARTVQVFSHDPLPAPDWLLQFWYGGASSAGGSRPDVGILDWEPVISTRTAIITIPNAPSIAIIPTNPLAPARSFSLVFEVEP